MMSKEAIRILGLERDDWETSHCSPLVRREAFDMAIEALKAQDVPDTNVGDLINRKWLLECVEQGWIKFDTEPDTNRFIHLVRDIAPSTQPEPVNSLTKSDMISKQKVKYKLTALVNEIEEIFANIREREVDDSVCGLCEYDGAYIGQSGDWCNECPGFEKDNCFKLKDKYRVEWESIDG